MSATTQAPGGRSDGAGPRSVWGRQMPGSGRVGDGPCGTPDPIGGRSGADEMSPAIVQAVRQDGMVGFGPVQDVINNRVMVSALATAVMGEG